MNIHYQVEIEIFNCNDLITEGVLVCANDFNRTVKMEKIGNCHIGSFYSGGIGPQQDFKKVPLAELDSLKDIIFGGKFVISTKELSYTKDKVEDVTTDSDLYRRYRICLDYDEIM